MHILIEDYLKKMAKKIRNKQAKLAAIEEIQNHFLDQVDALVEQGESYESSVTTVISNATDPIVLGKKLNLAHKPFVLRYPLTFFISSSMALGIVSLIIASHIAINKVREVYANSLIEEEVYTDFFKDLEDLKKKNLYTISRKRNVASFLLEHLDLYEEGNGKLDLRTFCEEHKACLGFENDKSQGQQLDIFKQEGISLAWIDKILEYDHWNFHADKIVSSQLEKAYHKSGIDKVAILSSYKFPKMNSFRQLVFLRAYQLLKAGETKLAEKLVDHSFVLYLSTNTILGGTLASHILLEKNEMINNDQIKEWQMVDAKLAKLYKRISWGWAGVFADMLTSKKYHTKLKPFLKPEFGACIGMVEQIGGVKGSEDFFDNNYFLEPTSPLATASMKKITADLVRDCDLPQLKPVLSKNLESKLFGFDGTTFYIGGFNPFSYVPLNPAKIPYVRSMFGAYLYAVAVPNFTRVYTLEKWRRRPSNI